MRNDNRAADDEAHRKRLEQLGARHALLGATGEMIRHAVIAPEDEGRDETEQLLGFHVERAGFVGARVEREEAVDDEVALAEDLSVQSLSELAELLQRTTVLVRLCIAALYR